MASTSTATAVQGATAPRTLPVRLTTRNPRYAIPDDQYLIPQDWKRFHLSQLVNTVLKLDKAVPFDFVVDGQLLRTDLGSYLRERGLSDETTLHIEYIESILPPEYISAFEHDDWVSAVDCQRKGFFLAASYDAAVRVYSPTSEVLYTIKGHEGPVSDVCWIPGKASLEAGAEEGSWVASSGHDRVVRVFQLPTLSSSPSSSPFKSATQFFTCHLHTQPIESVTSSRSGSHLLSAGWDGLIGVWSTDVPEEDEVEEEKAAPGLPLSTGDDGEDEEDEGRRKKKRRKAVNGAGGAGPKRKAPVQVLTTAHSTGHAARLSRAIFDRGSSMNAGSIEGTAYSAGWDHSVRMWDVENAVNTMTKSADKVIWDLDQMANSSTTLVTGNADRSVAVWDMRSDTANISLLFPSLHTLPVTSVRAHPTSAYHLCSASHDGTLKLWDTRSPKQALFSVPRAPRKEGLGKKILGIDWDGEIIVSGGEDCSLQVHRARVGTAAS